ncbi:MAG: N-6 DNA methylase [Planctomycetota bacterium]
MIVNKHIEVLSAFFHGTSVATGQKSFWPYDFGAIPVETISAIYEHFLKDKDKDDGAFYTPRFLAEVVLDVAFEKEKHLLGNTFLDPSCGSGIFLVGIFNRLAHEWRRDNPRARNNTLARELMKIIQESLFGIDINPTACRIAAFSLYLAYLDHLSPREIQQLQEKGRALPNLVSDEDNSRNLTCADFFSDSDNIPQEVSYVIGNPPWGSTAGPQTAAGLWCTQNGVELSDRQIASAFIRKGALHVREIGRVCFVLPAGVLFSRRPKATNLQIEWISRHTLECVLNLSDYRFFLFERATYPAIIARYRRQAPTNKQMVSLKIDYWSPKSDWSVTKAEIIRIAPNDRVQFSIGNLLRNLSGPDSSQIWKRHFWATARDRRLMERLSDHPRLKDNVRQTREQSDKRWLIAQGFQPLGPGDDPEEAKQIELPNSLFLEATTRDFNLFVEPSDCVDLGESVISVRKRSSVVTEVFKAPHVLISGGFSKIAFLDFDASFRSSVRGIHGPQEDANLLVFLAAYLKSKLARYFLFHISSSWAVDRPRVYDDEILLLPFPFPKDNANVDKANSIVATVNSIMKEAMSMHQLERSTKASIIDEAMNQIDECILDYFSITASERELINETINISIPSVHPTQSRLNVPTVRQSSANQRETYVSRVCDLLNGWSKRSGFGVRGQVISSEKSGIGLAVFEKVDRTLVAEPMPPETEGAIEIVYRLRQVVSKKNGALELTRGIKIFDRNKLYIVNTLDQRNWTLTSAMNDADEIAGTLLMKKAGQSV